MREIKAPQQIGEHTTSDYIIFLAGSIEMGSAEKWQALVAKHLDDVESLIILNPRRDNWDSSWEQVIENDKFREQVEWELWAMQYADTIVMYFDKDTMSPITLLELGLFARSGKLVVCCPNGFWKKGNVDIVCKMYNVKQVNTMDDMIAHIRSKKNESCNDGGL